MKKQYIIICLCFLFLFFSDNSFAESGIEILNIDISEFPDISISGVNYLKAYSYGIMPDTADYEILEQGSYRPDNIQVKPLEEPLSYNYILAVDNSRGLRRHHEDVQKTIRLFLESIRPEDRVALFYFDEKAYKINDHISQRDQLIKNAGAITYDARHSNIYDSLFQICEYASANKGYMDIILLLSDGNDRNSIVSPDRILDILSRENIRFMNIGFGRRRDLAPLERISALTVFESFRMSSSEDFEQFGNFLSKKLSNQISIRYHSALTYIPDNEYRISLRYTDNDKVADASYSISNLLPIKEYIESLAKSMDPELPEEAYRTRFIANYNDILRFDITSFPNIDITLLPYGIEADIDAYLNISNYDILEDRMIKPGNIEIKRQRNRLPYNYILVIDNSSEMAGYHDSIKKAVESFSTSIDTIDRLSLFIFDQNARKITDLSTDKRRVRSEIDDLLFYGRESNIFDSLFQVCEYSSDNRGYMNIIVLFTDGKDTDSMIHPDRLIDKLSRENIKFMNIGFGNNRGLTQLERISSLTGFESFRLNLPEDANIIKDFIPSRMNNQMNIRYKSNLDSIPEREYFANISFSSNGAAASASFSTMNLSPLDDYFSSRIIEETQETDIPLKDSMTSFVNNYNDILRFDLSQYPDIRMIALPYDRNADTDDYLDNSSYEILENGLYRPESLNVNRVVNRLPYNYFILIDDSRDLRNYRNTMKANIRTLLDSIDPSDRVSLFAFDENLTMMTDLITDRAIIMNEMDNMSFDSRFSNIYDSLFSISDYIASNKADLNIIILLTNGIDTDSLMNTDRVIDRLNKENIKLLNIGYGNNRGLIPLERMSSLTGFESFRFHSPENSHKIKDYIQKRTDNQIMLSYKSGMESMPDREYTASLRFKAHGNSSVSSFSSRDISTLRRHFISLGEKEAEAHKRAPWLEFVHNYSLIFAVLILVLGLIFMTLIKKKDKDQIFTVIDEPEEEKDIYEEEAVEHTQVLEDIPDLTEEELEEEEFDDEMLSKTVVMSEEPVIIIKQGSSRKITYDLKGKDSFTIGRAEGNDIVLANRSVSSKHCIIRKIGGAFVLYDLKSTNGSFINGQRIQKALLKPGDTIHIGETILDFQLRRK